MVVLKLHIMCITVTKRKWLLYYNAHFNPNNEIEKTKYTFETFSIALFGILIYKAFHV